MVSIIGISSIVMARGTLRSSPLLTWCRPLRRPPAFRQPHDFTDAFYRQCVPYHFADYGVIVVAAGMAGISPFDLVKRTAIPMIGAGFTLVVANFVMFL